MTCENSRGIEHIVVTSTRHFGWNPSSWIPPQSGRRSMPGPGQGHSSFVRMRARHAVRIREDEFLNSLARVHLSRVDVSSRVHGDCIDPMELSCHTAIVTNGARHLPCVAFVYPNLVIGAIGDKHVFLLHIMGKR